ncbi:MAG TPA: TOBE domain-containing protein [Caulobacteraceae bacterium]
MPRAALVASLTLRKGAGARVGGERLALLEAIGEHGSITVAAKAMGLSYKAAWDAVQAINNLFDRPLVAAHAGGRGGGLANVTADGRAVIETFRAVEEELSHVLDALERRLADPARPPFTSQLWSLGMKTSARNALRGVVSSVTQGAVNSEVVLRIAEGVELVAIITRRSVDELALEPGREAIALVKASSIILARGGDASRTSARNRLVGTVARCEEGAVNSEITIALDAGKSVTATITRQSARDLNLRAGEPAAALIKASSVILAVE